MVPLNNANFKVSPLVALRRVRITAIAVLLVYTAVRPLGLGKKHGLIWSKTDICGHTAPHWLLPVHRDYGAGGTFVARATGPRNPTTFLGPAPPATDIWLWYQSRRPET